MASDLKAQSIYPFLEMAKSYNDVCIRANVSTFVPMCLQVLFRRVLKGDISPANLSRMSPEELASKELAAWRQRENRHVSKQRFSVQRKKLLGGNHGALQVFSASVENDSYLGRDSASTQTVSI